MADDKQDIFGKIDALLEKRAGFGMRGAHLPAEGDFPLLTEVVEPQSSHLPQQDRRHVDRRQGTDRRQDERRKEARARLEAPHVSLSDEQFDRFLARFEQKLEDLFIRQQLRIDETIRQALQAQSDKAKKGAAEPL